MKNLIPQTQFQTGEPPIPIIDQNLCDGCGLCVLACPTSALALREGKAWVAHPTLCDYSGDCELVCPTRAIARPFEILIVNPIKTDSSKKEN